MSRGHLYWILSNPIYIGRLRHKGQIHEGLHSAIVDQGTWDQVQQRLAAQTQARRAVNEATSIPFLSASFTTIEAIGWGQATRPRARDAGATTSPALL